MTRFQEIKGLSEYVAKRISENDEEWQKFLDCAARFTPYSFKDQMLIYAQRPDAIACATMDYWNDKMNCWVNRGSKGIALIDESYDKPKLRYVFDVKDVHEGRVLGHKPALWKMKKDYEQAVINALEKKYGYDIHANTGFSSSIIMLAERITNDITEDHVKYELGKHIEGSALEGLEEREIMRRFANTFQDSLIYMISARCGEDYSARIHFGYNNIKDFNTMETLSALGNAIKDQVYPIMKEIGRTVEELDREHYADLERRKLEIGETGRENIQENEKILANGNRMLYNAGENIYTNKIENKLTDEESMDSVNNNGERSSYGEDIDGGVRSGVRTGRGLSDTESEGERGTAGAAHEVRTYETEIPKGQQEGSLRGDAPQGDTERALPDDTEAGRGDDGNAYGTDGEERGSERETQSNRPDEVGRTDEQHQGIGRGDSERRDNQQLSLFDLFPSMEEQVGTITAAEAGVKHTRPAAFSLPESQIDDVLRFGGGKDDSRKRIYLKYAEGKTSEEIQAFLIKEYGRVAMGYTFDNHPVSFWFDDSGMRAGYGTSAFKNEILNISWEEVEKRIRNLVENGSYINRGEAYLAEVVENRRMSDRLYFFYRDGIGEIPTRLNLQGYNYPKSMENLTELLSSHEGRLVAMGLLDRSKVEIEHGARQVPRWMFNAPDEIIEDIADFDRQRIELPLNDDITVKYPDFITQDEIDEVLRGGSGFSEGHFRIQDYFSAHHDKKDNIAFLKHEYGTGGRSNAILGTDHSWEDHDAKGIKLTKGSLMDPYANILLKWEIVEKRIRELVDEGTYLRPKAKEEYEQRKLEKAQKELGSQKQLTAEDVTNIKYISGEYIPQSHTSQYELTADIDGETHKIQYEVSTHDGGEESFIISTDGDNIYDRRGV